MSLENKGKFNFYNKNGILPLWLGFLSSDISPFSPCTALNQNG